MVMLLGMAGSPKPEAGLTKKEERSATRLTSSQAAAKHRLTRGQSRIDNGGLTMPHSKERNRAAAQDDALGWAELSLY